MTEVMLTACAVALLAVTLTGLIRVFRGPTAADRMLAALLLGSAGVAFLLVCARAWREPALRDVALVFALLASVSGVAFARRGAESGGGEADGG